MWLNKKDCSVCNRALSLFHWNKISNSRLAHRLSEHQKSHQQLRRNLQADQIIHSAADSAAVQFDWKAAVWEWKKKIEIMNNFICEFKNKKKIEKVFHELFLADFCYTVRLAWV